MAVAVMLTEPSPVEVALSGPSVPIAPEPLLPSADLAPAPPVDVALTVTLPAPVAEIVT
jgi:hypothetical protein